MYPKLSDLAPAVWEEVQKLNSGLRKIWDECYPYEEIGKFNDYKRTAAEKKSSDRPRDPVGSLEDEPKTAHKPIRHWAPVQYPDIVFQPLLRDDGSPKVSNQFEKEKIGKGLRDQADKILLFIGLNPSSPNANIKNATHDYETRNENYGKILTHERAVWENYNTYFKPIREFRSPLYRYHIDLYGIRHTSADVIEKFMLLKWANKHKPTIDKVNEFFGRQFMIVHEFLLTVEPAQAIIINADASRMFTSGAISKGYHMEDKDWIKHPARIRYQDPAQNNTLRSYIHASGMMSSGNMDNFSKARLEAVSYSVYKSGHI